MAEDLTQATNSKNKAGAKFKNISKTAETVQDQVLDTAKKTYGDVVERASSAFDSINASPMSYIRENPMQAALGGLLIGFLLGTAVSRRSIS